MNVKEFRYKDINSPIHKLNPLSKLIWVASIILLSLIFNDPLYILIPFALSISIISISKISKEWVSMVRIAGWFCLMLALINLFFRPTVEGLLFSIAMSIRLITIISAFAILTFTIHPDDLMSSMVRIGLPYRSVFVTSLSTRFFPIVIDDMQMITDALRSRGVELDKGGFYDRIKNRMEVVIPLLNNSLDRSIQIAEAMESRAFGSQKRTYYNLTRMEKADYLISLVALIPLLLGVFVRFLGFGG
ncbi:MAG: energy-coupling factor transporter transmembrane component T [Halobacteriota archaeon]|nr:energy-coupling factor transporter transmembrane component T [Halobacteriota archaeon]